MLTKNHSKSLLPAALMAAVFLLSACEEEARDYGVVKINGEDQELPVVTCGVHPIDGGPPLVVLDITLSKGTDEPFDSIAFSIQGPEGSSDRMGLLTPGEHPASGGHWDGIDNSLQPDTYFLNGLYADQMKIVWKDVEHADGVYSGTGYIDIMERITFECADSLWIDGENVGPGDPRYDDYYARLCSPPDYYPAQTIWFECAEIEGV